VILVAAWALAIAYAYPGLMSTDSVVQLLQARHAEPLGDWHPPLMAVMWRTIELLVRGPFGMLVLQTGTFLFGIDMILRRALSPRNAAIVAAVVLLAPPVLSPMAVIWKDCQMAGFLASGIGLVMSPRRGSRVVGCVLLAIATALRYNAIAATLPAVVLLFEWGWRGWRRYALAAAVWLAITVAAMTTNKMLVEREDHVWHSSIALSDIVGTIRWAHDWQTDRELEELLAGTPLVVHQDILTRCRWWYNPYNYWSMIHGDRRIFDPPSTAEQRDAIASTWLHVVTAHPGAYLAHRWKVFRFLLSSNGGVWTGFVEIPGQDTTLGSVSTHSPLQTEWQDANTWLSTTLLFRPRFYLMLALALLCLARSRLAAGIVASGVCYELSYFFLAASPDFRYSHWLIVCTLVGLVLVTQSRIRSNPSESSRAPPA
jgi:hypothetical protein